MSVPELNQCGPANDRDDVEGRAVGSASVGEQWAAVKCVHMHEMKSGPDCVQCGLCDGSVRPKLCTNPVLKTSSSHFKSAEGGPHSKRGGGKTSELASNFNKRGKFKKGMTTPDSTKIFSFSNSEAKNPYRGGVTVSTPTK